MKWNVLVDQCHNYHCRSTYYLSINTLSAVLTAEISPAKNVRAHTSSWFFNARLNGAHTVTNSSKSCKNIIEA